jgi:2'-hydroxyisoflavone reductase
LASTRREFLERTLAGSAALAAGSLALLGCQSSAFERMDDKPLKHPNPSKRILILGGTGFLGPKTVAAALARGHSVTVFNRGKMEKRIPFGFEGVEHLYGNRYPDLPADDARGPDGKLLDPNGTPKGLEQLVGKKWDAVIDNSGYFPRQVKASAELLAPNCGQYLFISSISAYASNKKAGDDEDSPLAQLADPNVDTMGKNYEFYGGLKAFCEQAAQAAFPNRCAVVRPGYIVGPGDLSDRFSYWPVRISKGGTIVAPGSPDDPIQWIDVRDLAEWLVKLVEDGTNGVFNAVGPDQPAKWGDVLAACQQQVKSNPATLVWMDADFIEKEGAGGEDGPFPIWTAPKGDYLGFHRWSNERAKKAGLKFRPIADTLGAILTWYPAEIERRVRVTDQMVADAKAKGLPPPKMGDPHQLRQGPPSEKEAALLKKWQELHPQ